MVEETRPNPGDDVERAPGVARGRASPPSSPSESREKSLSPDGGTLRLLEAFLFAAVDPIGEVALAGQLGVGLRDVRSLLRELQTHYADRGVHLVETEGRWAFRTAPDLACYFHSQEEVQRKLSKAALETLAIIAYHQPVTRAEIESIRGVAVSRGTLDLLLETGWIKPGKRRDVPGRPLTWLTTPAFLDHFGLGSLRDLPGVDDLRAAGLLDARPVLTAIPGRRNADDADEAGGAQGAEEWKED